MVTNNSANIQTAGLVKYNGTGTFTGVTTTIHDVLVGAASNGITSVAPPAGTGIPLISNGAAVDPSFGVAEVPGGGTGNDNLVNHSILIGKGVAAVGVLAPGNDGALVQCINATSDPAYTTAGYPATAGTSGNVITSNGTNFVSIAPAAGTKVTTYLASGSWTIDSSSKYVEMFGWGGGGGGASGRSGVSASAAGGGGGGAGGFVYAKFLSTDLTSSPYTVTIGAGASGGALANGNPVSGNNGNNGGTTSVGTVLVAVGGLAGNGGGTSSGLPGAGGLGYNLITLVTPPNAGGGTTTNGSAPTAQVYGWASGGGGGAGYTAATPRTGGAGGNITNQAGTVLVTGGLSGANTGGNGGNGNSPTGLPLIIGGSGGGGGGMDGVTTAGNGGNGAVPGGGGGGGAANLSLNNSGAGGNGADGKVVIIEYF